LIKNPRERDFVAFLRAAPHRLPSFLKLGLGDDAAIFKPTPGFESLLSCDLLIENVHFDLKCSSPWELGAKAVAASLSDIAAMGGIPRLYLVSLGIPKHPALSPQFFDALYSGMRAWSESFGAYLAGGDSTATRGPLVIDIFILGEIEKGRALLRSGARPGDLVYCSGHPGDAAAGLACLRQKKILKTSNAVQRGAASLVVKRHLLPVPRCIAGRFLSTRRAASACIDISDGLASELHHLATESKVAIDIEAEAIPLSASAWLVAKALRKDPLEWALSGGEDYELLVTVAPSKQRLLEREFSRMTGSNLTLIGRVKPGRAVRIRRKAAWKLLPDNGYEHEIF
jgi:thiamine-monophosphate kinase